MPNTGTAVKSKAATQTKIISEQVDEFTEAIAGGSKGATARAGGIVAARSEEQGECR